MFFKKSKPKLINQNPKARREKISDILMQRLSITCNFKGIPEIRSFVYTGELNQESNPDHPEFPFYYQYKLLKSEAGNLPKNYIEQLLKLQEIAIRQNVSMNDLLKHLLASTTGRKIAKINANSDSEQERLHQAYREKLEQYKQQKQQQMQDLLIKGQNKDNTIQEILAQGKKESNSAEGLDPIKANIQHILQNKPPEQLDNNNIVDPVKAQIQKIISEQKSAHQSSSHNSSDKESTKDDEGGDIMETSSMISKTTSIYSTDNSAQLTTSRATNSQHIDKTESIQAVEEISDEIVMTAERSDTASNSVIVTPQTQQLKSSPQDALQPVLPASSQPTALTDTNRRQTTVTNTIAAKPTEDDDPFSIDNLKKLIKNALQQTDNE